MHVLLVPGAWLLEGTYFPTGKPVQQLVGVTEVHSSEEFPETLRIEGEIREAANPTSRPVHSSFHLDVTSSSTVRFRMDSLPLGTVLVGQGFYDDFSLVLRYASPDRRIVGFESFVGCGPAEIRSTGVILADGSPVTSWLARLERLGNERRARRAN
jgi:hypothetical protein